jgi:hypothetical protein
MSLIVLSIQNFLKNLNNLASFKKYKKKFCYTGCLMKNASTHNFFIYYPISMSKKNKDMVFQALLDSHKMYFFWRYFQ